MSEILRRGSRDYICTAQIYTEMVGSVKSAHVEICCWQSFYDQDFPQKKEKSARLCGLFCIKKNYRQCR